MALATIENKAKHKACNFCYFFTNILFMPLSWHDLCTIGKEKAVNNFVCFSHLSQKDPGLKQQSGLNNLIRIRKVKGVEITT